MLAFLLVFSCVLTACTPRRGTASSDSSSNPLKGADVSGDTRLNVVTTLFPYYDFLRQIAGDSIRLTMVVPAGMDSHSFEPTPADMITIQNADLLVCNGGTMEQWLSQVLDSFGEGTGPKRVVTMMDCVDVVQEEIVEGMEDGEAHGHGHTHVHADGTVHAAQGMQMQGGEPEIEKSNILMLGPTGSGKTYLVKTLAKLLDVPLAIADATALTEAGYIGDDIESVVSKLLAAAGNDVEKAEQGIIFIDEIDKIAKKKNTMSRDVSGESVQQELLKLLEGSQVEVPVGSNQKNALTPMATVDTNNILFICGGAFPGLDDIIKERLKKRSTMGFNSHLKDEFDNDPDILSQVTTEDLRNFGMIPEFLGRLPVLVSLQGLTKELLMRILKEPKNAILKQYERLLALDEVKLVFEDDALEWIAERALEKDTGARALRAILEDFMMDIMYEIPKDPNIGSVVITRPYLEKKGGPRIEMRG